MAYVGNNLSAVNQTIEGGFNMYYYTGTDAVSAVIAANYFSDGVKRGMEPGDFIVYWNSATSAMTLLQCSTTQQAAGSFGATAGVIGAGTGSGVVTSNTAINTVGAATLPAAAIVGGLITRGGTQTAAFTDTTDTAANIIAAMASQTVGNSWTLRIINNSLWPETIAAGSGVTLSGSIVVPANSYVEMLVTYSAAGAITMYGYLTGENVSLPNTQYTTGVLTAATLTAAQIAGANFVQLNNSGNTPGTQTLPSAAVLFGGIPNCQPGFSYVLRLLNAGTGTETLAADAGSTITVTGRTSITTLTWVDYQIKFTSATAATCQSIGGGVAP